ncbi:MAG TPA: 30S ribosomal protein S13 [Candidatus Pacearchaeota archaeon]|nr:30S ribosomal protein S13 [Candidatus Pacearchaeota archaeon]
MPRISGVNIPDNKNIEISLTYIHGIGRPMSRAILDELKIDQQKKAGDLTADEVNKLKHLIDDRYKIEGSLRQEVTLNVRRLKEIGCWRGDRHKKGLPVRGQQTRTNSRTVRGNVRRSAGSGRKLPPAPK